MYLQLNERFSKYRRNKHLYSIKERESILKEFDAEFHKTEAKQTPVAF